MRKLQEVLQKKEVPKKKAEKTIHLHCKVCGYDWWSRVENPKECPTCRSRYWKTGLTPEGKKATSTIKGDKYE